MSLRLTAVLLVLVTGAVLSCGAVQAQSDSAVLMTVDGLPVTRGEWDKQNANFESLIACAKSRGEFGPADQGLELAPRDMLLAGSYAVSLATEAEAKRRGLAFTDEEIVALVAEGRAALEQLRASGQPLPCGVQQVAREIEEHGEREYWGRIAPAEYRKGLGAALLAREGAQVDPLRLALNATIRFYGELRDREVTELEVKEFLEGVFAGP